MLSKSEIDGAYKKKSHKFADDFSLRFHFWKDMGVDSHESLEELYQPPRSPKRSPPRSPSHSPGRSPARSPDPMLDSEAGRYSIMKWGAFLSFPPCLRVFNLALWLDDLFKVIATDCRVYSRGEIVYNPEESDRSLHFISSGNLILDTSESKAKERSLGSGLYEEEMVWGAREFFGELSFLLGNGQDNTSGVLRAYSEQVEVRSLRLSELSRDPLGIPPLVCENLSPRDLDILYEALAR